MIDRPTKEWCMKAAELERGEDPTTGADPEQVIAHQSESLSLCTARITELEAALERALADGAAMRAALEKAAVLDVGRPIPRGGYEAALVEGIVRGQDEARDYVKAIVAKALTEHPGDGSRIMDVVRRNLEAIQIRCREGDKHSDWLPIIDRLATEALDNLDRSEGG